MISLVLLRILNIRELLLRLIQHPLFFKYHPRLIYLLKVVELLKILFSHSLQQSQLAMICGVTSDR
jgi:uncharacterized protein YigA (DUF484 family)